MYEGDKGIEILVRSANFSIVDLILPVGLVFPTHINTHVLEHEVRLCKQYGPYCPATRNRTTHLIGIRSEGVQAILTCSVQSVSPLASGDLANALSDESQFGVPMYGGVNQDVEDDFMATPFPVNTRTPCDASPGLTHAIRD